ncbi:MAG: alpha/beta hydrolase [Pseudomonadota bacterium]
MSRPEASAPPALDAEQIALGSPAGELNLYVAGEGPPLLLIHSINAVGSAYEVKPVFEHYRDRRRVVALDLPGFGASERSDRRYDIDLFTNAIAFTARHVAEQTGQAVDAVALSLSAEFLARAARDDLGNADPALRSLALISPTGFRRSDARRRGPDGASREIAWLSGLLRLGLVGEPLYRLLTRRSTIRFFLNKTWGSSNYDQGLADYDVLLGQQPGAHHAPLAFVSGQLFSNDIRNVYEALTQRVFLAHGTRGDFTDYRGAEWTATLDNWVRIAFDAGAFPHFEKPDAFFAALDRFLLSSDVNAV